MSVKGILVTVFLCTLIALISTAITSNIFIEWSTILNGAISGVLAGIASIYIVPWAKQKY